MSKTLAALLLAATAFSAGTADAPKASKSKEKKMATEWHGSQGGGDKAGVELALDQAQWEALWKRLGQPAPKADLAQNAAAAVFLGMRPTSGYGVQWLDVRQTQDAAIARWRENKPGASIVMEVITYPWAVKLFSKTGKPLRVEAEAQ